MFIKSALSPQNQRKWGKSRVEKAKQQNKQKIKERNNKIFDRILFYWKPSVFESLAFRSVSTGVRRWCLGQPLKWPQPRRTHRSEINEIIQIFFFYFYMCYLNGCKLLSKRWGTISCSFHCRSLLSSPLFIDKKIVIIPFTCGTLSLSPPRSLSLSFCSSSFYSIQTRKP